MPTIADTGDDRTVSVVGDDTSAAASGAVHRSSGHYCGPAGWFAIRDACMDARYDMADRTVNPTVAAGRIGDRAALNSSAVHDPACGVVLCGNQPPVAERVARDGHAGVVDPGTAATVQLLAHADPERTIAEPELARERAAHAERGAHGDRFRIDEPDPVQRTAVVLAWREFVSAAVVHNLADPRRTSERHPAGRAPATIWGDVRACSGADAATDPQLR